MELSPERKQQIEEEEKQRLAEEQYRSEVRSRLSSDRGVRAPFLASRTPEPEPQQKKSPILWIIGALAVALVVAAVLGSRAGRAPAAVSDAPVIGKLHHSPSIRYAPVDQKIASGQIVVRHGGYVQYRFQITPDMQDAHVIGRFNASGGTGNDIEAVIAIEDEFTNWVNGHKARVFYSTLGRKTTDAFDVRLAPGTYYLGFSNRFSALSEKEVFLEVDLKYQRIEAD